jgi:hypothetical protein
MVQRVAVIGFVVALVIAVLAFSQQQTAVQEAQTAAAAQAESEAGRATAVALSDSAATAQADALAAQATAQTIAETQSAAAAQAQAALETAQADSQAAFTRAAAIQASATAGANVAATAAAVSADAQAAAATAGADQLATMGAQIASAATAQTAAESELATATAALDLALFARESAEADRAAALEQAWAAATEIAGQQAQVATAQAILNGAPTSAAPQSPTDVPATATLPEPTAAPTEASPAGLSLDGEFISRDDSLRFNMPGDWVSGELDNGIVLVGSSNAVFQRVGSELSAGMFEIDFVRLPLANLDNLNADSPISEVMTQVIAVSSSGGSGPTNLGEVSVYDINGIPAARVEGDEGGNKLVLTVLKPVGVDTILLAFAYAIPDELPGFLPTLDNILNSVRLSAPQPTATTAP